MANQYFMWVAEWGGWELVTMWVAMRGWVYEGREVAYGRLPPMRGGVDQVEYSCEQRREVWGVFLESVTSAPYSRSSSGVITHDN